MADKNQAPNMYVNWASNQNYDYVMVDWYCEEDAVGTYWAVHRWWHGYAGFQNAESNHKILMALWDIKDSSGNIFFPEIEYLSPRSNVQNLDFGNEGTGKHIFTDYQWEANTWYTMCIGTKTMFGKTYYAQWVRKVGNDEEWYLAAIISCPINTSGNYRLDKLSMFQEDFGCNKSLSRKCRLKNAYGHLKTTDAWESLRTCEITNSVYPDSKSSEHDDNIGYNCDWARQDGDYVWVKCGGNTPDLGVKPPYTFHFTNAQPSVPVSIPEWADILPKFIKSNYSSLYAYPLSNKLVQSETAYLWHFVDSGDGYFHILTPERTRAATLSGKNTGADLILSDFDLSADNQKWTKSAVKGDVFYLRPKAAPNMYMDIEGPSKKSGAVLQIWTSDPPATQYEWQIGSIVEEVSIKSYYSNLYMNPSGSKVVQKSKMYKWHFAHASDGCYYILTPDHTKAVTLSGTTDGKDLVLTTFSATNQAQKWYKVTAGDGLYHLIPESARSMTIDIEGPSKNEGAVIQIWTRDATSPQFKWEFIS